MYNRYIPQSDGTYTRRHVPDPPKKPAPPPPPPCSPPEPPAPCPPPPPACRPGPPPRPKPRPCREQDNSIGGFIRQLLPKGFDATDLLVVVLLLLMTGDCPEDQNTALLTLALYLFL